MRIIVYTKTGCHWAEEVMDFLTQRGIAFEERNMFEHPEYKKEALEKSGQWKSPTLDIDGYILPDTDVGQVEKYLDKKVEKFNQSIN